MLVNGIYVRNVVDRSYARSGTNFIGLLDSSGYFFGAFGCSCTLGTVLVLPGSPNVSRRFHQTDRGMSSSQSRTGNARALIRPIKAVIARTVRIFAGSWAGFNRGAV